jgi:LynF/TruF/PatF family peptide O-prenyltransferase
MQKINWKNLDKSKRDVNASNSFIDSNKYFLFKEVFSVTSSPAIDELEGVLKQAKHVWIEPSIKIDSAGEVFSSRFNVWYRQPHFEFCHLRFLDLCQSLEKQYRVQFELSKLDFLFSAGLSFDKDAYSVVFGTDIRPDLNKSRLKFWTLLKKDASRDFIRFANLEFNLGISEFFIDKIILVGLDVGFDGKTRFKFYPYFEQMTKELEDEMNFTNEEKKILEMSEGFHLELLGKEIPFSPRYYGAYLPHIVQHQSIASLDPFRLYVIQFPRSEVQRGMLKSFNIYF